MANLWLSQVAVGGKTGHPVLIGPVAYLFGVKPTGDAPVQFNPLDRLGDVLTASEMSLAQFVGVGADWVRLDEPGLVRGT